MSGVKPVRNDQPRNILVSVWPPVIDLFNRKVLATCLRRDAFLDRVLSHEAKMLALEVTTPNSESARAYLANELGKLPRKQVNLRLRTDTVQLIHESCDATNVPRDAFFNRVFLLLVEDRPFFKKLLPGIDWRWAAERMLDDYWNYFDPTLHTAMTALQDIVQSDPFRFYRACIELQNREIEDTHSPGLHEAFVSNDFFTGRYVPETAIGFNCYVPDWRITPTTQEERPAWSLDDML